VDFGENFRIRIFMHREGFWETFFPQGMQAVNVGRIGDESYPRFPQDLLILL
jgi:hypothetical protein